MNSNEMSTDPTLKLALSVLEAHLEECRFFWNNHGEQYHRYRKLQKALATNLLAREMDESFREFVIGFNPLFSPTSASERQKALLQLLDDPAIKKAAGMDHGEHDEE